MTPLTVLQYLSPYLKQKNKNKNKKKIFKVNYVKMLPKNLK